MQHVSAILVVKTFGEQVAEFFEILCAGMHFLVEIVFREHVECDEIRQSVMVYVCRVSAHGVE